VFVNVRDGYLPDRPVTVQLVLGNTGNRALRCFIERYDRWSNWRWRIRDADGQPVEASPGPDTGSAMSLQLDPGTAAVEEFDLREKFHLRSGTYSVSVERLVMPGGGQQFLARSAEFHFWVGTRSR
jgi:hypothetical protein